MSIDSFLCGSNIEQKILAITMNQHARLGKGSCLSRFDNELTRMIVDSQTYSPEDVYDQLMQWFLRDKQQALVQDVLTGAATVLPGRMSYFLISGYFPDPQPLVMQITIFSEIDTKSTLGIKIAKGERMSYSDAMSLPDILTLYKSLLPYLLEPIHTMFGFIDIFDFFDKTPPIHTRTGVRDRTYFGGYVQDRFVIENRFGDKKISVNYTEDRHNLHIIEIDFVEVTKVRFIDIVTPAELQEMKDKIVRFLTTNYRTFLLASGLLDWIASQLKWYVEETAAGTFKIMERKGRPIGIIDTKGSITVTIDTQRIARISDYTPILDPLPVVALTEFDIETKLKPYMTHHAKSL